MTSEIKWRKSTYSNVNGECVELTTTLDRIRDSKDPNGPTLRVNAASFVHAVKQGRFDR
ncbi:DUF397 domain-containing protein [Saccharopolyspora phatthalungensis]|uniref:DUF397 domain-containing protein n=1 Tax=Saccharopolyspora phatthalungensis TaxID=664693 RepID=A0A840QJW8_9PSEU|nr:DUF397 domain-containing protein [Saccharopolyspora phatthalungensis]MBB5159718.1 hypothetical protein [Saccharopolyspora phatthalungensis]